MGVNVPNFGPGTEPGVLRRWAQTVEGLGFDLLMISDHIAVTPDVAEQYPASFYEPFTTLAWLAGITGKIRLGTTVLIVPSRHPLLSARMAANLNDLSGGRLVLEVGAGWAVQEFTPRPDAPPGAGQHRCCRRPRSVSAHRGSPARPPRPRGRPRRPRTTEPARRRHRGARSVQRPSG